MALTKVQNFRFYAPSLEEEGEREEYDRLVNIPSGIT